MVERRKCSTCGKPTFDQYHTVCAECSGIQRARVDAVAQATLDAMTECCPCCHTLLTAYHRLDCPVAQRDHG